MTDIVEKLQELIADGVKALETAQAAIEERDRRIAELEATLRDIVELAADEDLPVGARLGNVDLAARTALPTPPTGESDG